MPFTMSDGTNTFTFTQAVVGTDVPLAFCFDFETSGTSVGDCTTGMSAINAPDATFAITFSGNGGLPPSTPGSFSAGQFAMSLGAFVTSASGLESSQGTVSLTVVDTNPAPEPATAALIGSALITIAAWGWGRVRRRGAGGAVQRMRS